MTPITSEQSLAGIPEILIVWLGVLATIPPKPQLRLFRRSRLQVLGCSCGMNHPYTFVFNERSIFPQYIFLCFVDETRSCIALHQVLSLVTT